MGALGRGRERERERDELAAGHQPLSWDAEEPKVEEVEKPFIYEGEGVKVGGLCVDFRWHTTPFLVAQRFSFFSIFVSFPSFVLTTCIFVQ